ncbi:MAG: DMT family transporter [Spirochaetia bacterium]|nr:DMT family transporter [Spirochaetia bacterium]
MKTDNKIFGLILLLAASVIWGMGSIFCSGSLKTGSFTLNAMGTLLAAILLLPFVFLSKCREKGSIKNGIFCGISLFIAMSLYRFGGNSFLAGFFIIIIPIYALISGEKLSSGNWGCILMTMAGLYIITHQNGLFKISFTADKILGILAALGTAVHIIMTDRFAKSGNPLRTALIQFLTAGILNLIFMLLTEKPESGAIISSWGSIVYTGIFVCSLAFTFQIYAQQLLDPVMTSLFISYRIFFAALAGIIFMGNHFSGFFFSGIALLCCALLFYFRSGQIAQDGSLIDTDNKDNE